MTTSLPTGEPADAHLIVLVRLRPGTDRAEYERFSAEVDRPGVLAHYPSVEDWRLYRIVDGGGEYDYVEVAVVRDVDGLRDDMASPAATELARQARTFIEAPTPLIARRVV